MIAQLQIDVNLLKFAVTYLINKTYYLYIMCATESRDNWFNNAILNYHLIKLFMLDVMKQIYF